MCGNREPYKLYALKPNISTALIQNECLKFKRFESARVVWPREVPAMYGEGAMEEHLIPLVRDIVPQIDPQQHYLVITPPQGLLHLGRQRMLLRYLEPQLQVRRLVL